ncbi:mediator of RNA polymerase II transcription subunit 14 isoform 2 [Galdieria sulphuraria]|uniref:Mediator of RNA polymerase II transcription subunit 14 n=1 Tax=Galdieria sulphuraria TaxID=130081 RepID=M2XAK4_GALSU|nr:mediator of RNA polymerase II transcription subunit 14 isoform 2 [Galdieria sulphuraria]EME26902.1 mediator of RNA polymerase II transcription subunit 14 isoform 2 [Galdieria sulphuraria]|eukprot:XP_005703422.1 mediator of RNA polymerase II transcription subunit 14 isoform 2 [Galdieria sulphuraria]
MNDQLIPKVSLARLIRYTTRNCYKELQKLVENCLDEEGTVAKVLLYEFLLSERYRFTRLLVLLKWYCRYGGADEFCEEKIAESSSLLALYESSADGLWTVHNKLSDACLPLIPIQSATEILTTGGYSRLPSIVYRNFVSKEFLLSLDEGKTSPSVMQNNDWMGLVSRALLQSCLSKENDLRIFNWKDKQREQAVEVGNRRGGWSLVLMATRIGDHFSWKLLQVRVYIRGASLGGTTDRQSNQVSQSVLSKEQESYLRGICQHILEQNCGSEEESRLYISQAIAESGKFLEEKICVPLALDILRLQAFRLSKNPLFLFKIQKDIDAVLLRFWEDPLSSCTEIRISSLKEDDDMKDENISQQIVEYQNGCSIFVVRRWPFCIYMSLMDSKQRSDSSKDSLLRQVVMNKKSTKILSKTISEQILDISVQKISIESILFQLLAFKCQFLLERLKDDLTSRQGQELDAKQISLEYESVYLGDREEAVKVAYLIVEISKSLVIRIQMSLISGKLCCYTYEGYAWIKDKRRSTGYTEFSSMDYSGIVQFIIDHQKCIVRTSTYCQTKAVSLVIKEDYFTPRSLNEKLMNAVWDKYGLSCYADLDTCIALSPIGWFGTNESKRSLRSEGYEFYCDTLTPYNLFFVYQKDFHSSWLLTHSLNACLGARWLAIIETRKRQRELETVLEVAPLEWSFQQQLFDSNVKDNCHNGFSYPVEENSMRNIHVMRPLSIPAEKGVFYNSSSGIRRIWFDLAFSLLDEGYGLSWKRLLRRFSEVPWPENQGVRLWHFGGQNLKASLILTYAHGHVCLRRVTGDIFIAQQMSKLIRRISAYPSQFMDLVWKNWRELVVVSRPLCKNITLSSASTGLMKQIPSVYIRVDLRRQHTSRSMMIGTEQVKGEGRTIADFKANNKVNSTEAKLQRQRMLSQSIQHELPLPTIQIFPLTQFSKDACELLEEVLSWSPNHMDHYLDILLDHICFIVACLMLLGNRCFISWSSLFRFEISLPIIKEKERVMFCGFEVGCEESPKSILLKNLGHYMKSPNVGGPATTNKDKVEFFLTAGKKF